MRGKGGKEKLREREKRIKRIGRRWTKRIKTIWDRKVEEQLKGWRGRKTEQLE